MTAYSLLKQSVSRDLADPGLQTFDALAVHDFIQQGFVAIGRLAPQQFQEDLDVVEGQLTYQLRSDDFNGQLVPEIRLVRVEIWQGVPPRFAYKVKAKAGQPSRDSIAGWEVWNGKLELPQGVVDSLTAEDSIRVWGYSPYPPCVNDDDVVPVSAELELAIRTFCRVEGLRRLTSSRVLFKQWQTKSNNTDVTLGMLNSDLQVADEEWRRLSRAIKVLEQNPD